jgi:hypothetical protein
MSRSFMAVLLFVCLPAATLQAAVNIDIGTGSELKLTHGEGTRFARTDGTSVITLLFSERKPENVVLIDEFGNDDLSLAKWMSSTEESVAVRISFTEGDEENFSLNLYLGNESVALGGHNSGQGVRGVFRTLEIDGDRISGTVERSDSPGEMRGTFDTHLVTIKEAAWISGSRVAQSPQGQALLAYAAAMRKFDYKAASRHSVRDEVAETAKTREIMGDENMKKLIAMEFSTAKEFEKLLSSPDASMAEGAASTKIRLVKRDGSSTETSTIGLVKVGSEWKVNW